MPESRVSRLRESAWLRGGLLLAVVGLAVYGLASQWTQVHADLAKLAWYDVTGAALCVLAGLGCMMLAWRALLADLGSPLPLVPAIRVMFVGQLGKYVPGAVWAVAAQVELARDYEIPRRRSGTASLVAMATTLVVGLVVAGVTLPLISASAARHYWWVLAVTPFAVACLYPPVIKFGLDLALKTVRKPPLEKSVSVPGMARALAWTTLGWLFYGAHAYLLISEFAGRSPHTLALSLGAYALAWSVGFLIIFVPGGIGAREVALIAVLAPVMPSASALVVALASRVVMTVGDLVWAGVGLAIGRTRSAAREAVTRPGPAADPPSPSDPPSSSDPPSPSDPASAPESAPTSAAAPADDLSRRPEPAGRRSSPAQDQRP